MSRKGKIYLVGAGPGDKGLLTLKGAQVLSKADLVFYDNLVNPEILEYAPPHANCVYVGKRGLGDKTSQTHIEDQLVQAVQEGKCVIRLKGGDPFLFGRGGEEAERLAQENIPFEIVPGVSSLIAAPAYAGIPLTHRDWSSTLAFVTGYTQENSPYPIDWPALAKMQTIVLVMGVKTLQGNCARLLQGGMRGSTPVAIIRWGTTPRQKTYISTLEKVADEMQQIKLMPPVVMVIGEVVKLRSKLCWYEKLPLFGKKILVTRAASQISELSDGLSALGAEVYKVPSLEFSAPDSWEDLDQVSQNLSQFEWLVFSSAQGVEFFMKHFLSLHPDIRLFPKIKIACVGPKTALALEKFYLKADRVAQNSSAAGLAQEMILGKMIHGKVLFVRAQEGREEFVERLLQENIFLTMVFAYKTQACSEGVQKLQQGLDFGKLDLLLFASASAIKNLFALLNEAQKNMLLKRPCLCIGPTTAQTAKDFGFLSVVQSEIPSVESLIEKAIGCF
ncbi:MAG: uroporphyrinogen-III C-methyltransferase [Deltaproteobacteria bacterium]|nr:uroporphyrinogen-III C-methyltransferase [Deltaproteobacteria bacterium]